MTAFWIFLGGVLLGAYRARVQRLQREQAARFVMAPRRRPSPWITPPQPLQTAVSSAPRVIPPSVARAPQPSPVSAPVVAQTPIAAKPPTVGAPVVVTFSAQIRTDALMMLERLGYSKPQAVEEMRTPLGLAIQQSLQKG